MKVNGVTGRDESAAPWIVCCGETRDVVEGRVTTCPFAAHRMAAFEDCLECRHLQTLKDDRALTDCATDGDPFS